MAALNTEEIDGVLVVAFTDTKILDEAKIQQIGSELMECAVTAGDNKLLLDFDSVSFMSSAMIGKLVLLHKKCKASDVTLKVCNISDNVMEVFKITRLHKVFDIHKDREKALKSFDKKSWFG